MNNKFMKMAFAGLVLTVSGLANAGLIDFDFDSDGNSILPNTSITNQYQSWGVTFAGYEDGGLVNINAAPDPDGVTAPSGTNVLTNCSDASGICPGNRADIIDIFFATSVSNISLMLDTLGGDSVTFELFDFNNVLLETQTITSFSSTYVPVLFTASGVSRVRGLQPNDDWAWAMDDLSFIVNEVPEPSTLAIFALGLLGLASRRFKKQS